MGKKSRFGGGIQIRDEHPGSCFPRAWKEFLGLKILNSLMRMWSRIRNPGIFLTLDPGWKKFESGINIPDPQHWWQPQNCLPPAPLLVHLGAGRHSVNGHEENLTGLDHPEEDLPHTRNAVSTKFRKLRTGIRIYAPNQCSRSVSFCASRIGILNYLQGFGSGPSINKQKFCEKPWFQVFCYFLINDLLFFKTEVNVSKVP